MNAFIKRGHYKKLDSSGIPGLIICIFLALVYSYFFLPNQFIVGTSSFWNAQNEDITTYQAGFNAFFREPWQWPILQISSLNWPEGTLATFVDIIPIYSIVLKALAPQKWFPFNPFGLWIFICIILQSAASWWILREAQIRSWIVLLVLTLILLTEPSWLNRISHHTSLFSHWLLLFGFALVLRDQRYQRFSFWPWFILLFSAIFINIYLALMVGLMALSSWWIRFHESPSIALVSRPMLAIFCLTAIISLTMWPLTQKAASTESGFGLYSLNLASPWSGGLFIQIQPDANSNEQRFEGFNYLGCGVIGLLVISLLTTFNLLKAKLFNQKVEKSIYSPIFPYSIWWLFLIFFLYALSNKIYWGNQLAWEWTIPDWAQVITGQFRVSGRFFWPVGYGLTIFVVIFVYRRFKPTLATICLLIAGLIQLIDVSPLVRTTYEQLNRISTPTIDFKEWQTQIPARIKTLYLFPKIKCNTKSSFLDMQLPLTLFASIHKFAVNTAYMARYNPACSSEGIEIAASDFNTSAYIFVNEEYSANTIRSFFPANAIPDCRNISPFTLCFVKINE